MGSIYKNLETLTSFRKILAKFRNGRKPEDMKEKHDARVQANRDIRTMERTPKTIMQILAKRKEHSNYHGAVAIWGNSPGFCLIPLGFTGVNNDIPEAILPSGRKKNLNNPVSCFGPSRMITSDLGKYSRRCTYRKYSYTQHIESWGYVPSPKAVYVYIHHAKGILKRLIYAPKGYHWENNRYGIALVSNTRKGHDYHPSADDFIQHFVNPYQTLIFDKPTPKSVARKIDRAGIQYLVNKIKENARFRASLKRKDQEEKKQLALAIREGCKVCILDSLKAGNCHAGTMRFAANHKIDSTKHYSPKTLWELAPKLWSEDKKRLKLVFMAAVRRHRAEMSRGFSYLSDHVYGYPIHN